MRVRLNASEVTLTPVTTTTSSTTNTNSNSSNTNTNTNSNANGEGEGEGSAMAFAPLTNQTLVNATRLEPSIPTFKTIDGSRCGDELSGPKMQLVSEAGDYIAQSQGTQPTTSGLVDVDGVLKIWTSTCSRSLGDFFGSAFLETLHIRVSLTRIWVRLNVRYASTLISIQPSTSRIG